MVNENIIPKTETIYELKEEYKIPSFEEFMNTYEMDERVNASYDLESKDRALHGPQYGPGNSQSSSKADQERQMATGIGAAGAAATAALTFVCPPAGLAVAGTYAAVGTTAKVVENLSTDEDVKRGAGLADAMFSTAKHGGDVAIITRTKCPNHVHR